jgi:hypothetical protein
VIQKGDLVKIWYDNGLGVTQLYGRVLASGPKMFEVEWWSGQRNRFRFQEPKGVEKITEAWELDEARRLLKLKGPSMDKKLPAFPVVTSGAAAAEILKTGCGVGIDLRPIPVEQFGKDHWSTFAYLETRTVDYQGVPDLAHMRNDPRIHPLTANQTNHLWPDQHYSTRLRDGSEQMLHDDWSCLEDLEKAGLLENIGTGTNPVVKLTPRGLKVAAQLRAFKSRGGKFADYVPEEI